MALSHITDHQARAVARLVAQYRSAPNLQGLITSSVAEIQTLEDELWKMFIETLDTATGAQLDVYGAIVGQEREERDDATYRLWIRTRVKINRSSGTATDILAVFTALLQGTSQAILDEQYPAGFVLRLVSIQSTLSVDQAHTILLECKPAGVYAILESPTIDDAHSFAFDPLGAGFGDADDALVGGQLATAY